MTRNKNAICTLTSTIVFLGGHGLYPVAVHRLWWAQLNILFYTFWIIRFVHVAALLRRRRWFSQFGNNLLNAQLRVLIVFHTFTALSFPWFHNFSLSFSLSFARTTLIRILLCFGSLKLIHHCTHSMGQVVICAPDIRLPLAADMDTRASPFGKLWHPLHSYSGKMREKNKTKTKLCLVTIINICI